MPNFNLGLTLKPLPIGSVYAAYATSSNPVGAEFDGTSAHMAASRRCSTATQPDLRAGEEQGDRSRHQVGAVRPAPAGDRRAVPDRKGKCARIAERQQLRPRLPAVAYPAGTSGTYPASRRRGLSHPRHRSRRRRQDHRQMERVRRPGADAVGGDEVAGSVAAASCSSRPMSGCQLANVAHQSFSMLTQVSAHRRLGARRAGGLPLEDLRRHVPRREPGHVDPELLALRRLRGSQDQQELDGEAVRQQHLQQALLRRAVSERDAVRARSAGPQRVASGDLGAVLTESRDADGMLICVPDVLSKDDVADFRRIMDACRLGGRPLHRRRAVGAGQEQRAIAAGQRGRAQARQPRAFRR